MPDKSYDLDGDGFVGNRDYVIAKHFDKDQNGKLNASERLAAMTAVQNVRIHTCSLILFIQGFEDKFVWNVEQAGA